MTSDSAVRRPRWMTIVLLGMSAVLIVGFVMLGNWQIRRLYWKLDLIEAVESRAFGLPERLPDDFDPTEHAYLRVAVSGEQAAIESIRVKAVTELGLGSWVMTPLQTQAGVLWINRGFVPQGQSVGETWLRSEDRITGLLRPTEPDGTLLEKNDPQAQRWVSRDTVAMSDHLGLGETLPYFVDVEDAGTPGTWPRGGLTIVSFRNSHLAYALTWYAMAILFLAALIYVGRTGWIEVKEAEV